MNPATRERGEPRRSWVHCPPGPWTTLLDFLCERFAHVPPAAWRERLARGDVRTDAGDAVLVDAVFVPNRLLSYQRELPAEVDAGWRAQVVFEDAQLLVADKPHGQPVTPSGAVLAHSLLRQMMAISGCTDLQPIHRIDADTAGLVAFAKQVPHRAAYQRLFAERRVHKRYLAVSDAVLTEPPSERLSRIEPDPTHFMRMREVAGEPNAHTRLSLLGEASARAHWALEPVSGKRHQLRVHLWALGAPIANDGIYPTLLPERSNNERAALPLQLLAHTLSFECPISAQSHRFVSRQRLLHWQIENS